MKWIGSATFVAIGFALLLTADLSARPLPDPPSPPASPPPAPPVIRRAPAESAARSLSAAGLDPYSIGDVTDFEQLFIEFINRARSDPVAEGHWLRYLADPDVRSDCDYFQVDLDLLEAQLGAYPPGPPLAPNARLRQAARLHSQDMFEHMFQSHTGSDGRTLTDRIVAAQYPYQVVAENVFAYAESVLHGHAGFVIDWGPGPGGVQNPPGHRHNTFEPEFREIGVGAILGTNGAVGPIVVTQNFGLQSTAFPFLTGVAFYDLNGNGFYDLGEGIGGIDVRVSGASFYAVTAPSGGYAIPLPGNGSFLATFSAPGLAPFSRTFAVTNLANRKIDFLPPYEPPVVSGPARAALFAPNLCQLSMVGAATGYDWRATRLLPTNIVETVEAGLDRWTLLATPGYDVRQSDAVSQGAWAIRLAHPQPADQILELDGAFLLSASSGIQFASRLNWATPTQIARLQISTDNGLTWSDLWSEPGIDDAGADSFQTVVVPLAPYAGQSAQFRFVYDYTGGSRYPQTDPGIGLHLDDIRLSAVEQLEETHNAPVPQPPSFVFEPTLPGDYSLQARARIGQRALPWGPMLRIAAGRITDTILHLESIRRTADSQLELVVTLANGTANSIDPLSSPSPAGPWQPVANFTITNGPGSNQFRILLPIPSISPVFYRVAAP